MQIVPACLCAARISSASRRVKHIGFSAKTCLPALSASTITFPWESADRTTTASSGSFKSSWWLMKRSADAVVVADVLQRPGRDIAQGDQIEEVVQLLQVG